MAGHLAGRWASTSARSATGTGRPGRVESLGYYPPPRIEEIEPYFDVAGYPETMRVLERQETVIIDADDPRPTRPRSSCCVRDGNRMLAMLPLVAKGQSIGLVELFSKDGHPLGRERLELARTMANEAAMALENARLYEDARKLADRDPLTGFYNHRFLHERLGEEVVRAQRGRRPLSVLMLDLDDFKLVNDTFGHLFGDRVLTWTAELIRSTLRGLGHPGALRRRRVRDHPAGDRRRGARAAERILEAFRDRPFVGEQRGPVPIAASIGVATFPVDGRTATELIAAADAALYQGQARGRPRRRPRRGDAAGRDGPPVDAGGHDPDRTNGSAVDAGSPDRHPLFPR